MDDTWVSQSINILHVYFRFIWNFNMAVLGLLCFLIGLDFKSLPLYNCMCNGIVSWQECSVYRPLKKIIQSEVQDCCPSKTKFQNRTLWENKKYIFSETRNMVEPKQYMNNYWMVCSKIKKIVSMKNSRWLPPQNKFNIDPY